jgi:hypothetical protein
MPNLLHRLKINEVSSCRVGAGHGVKVMLMKSADSDPKASASLLGIFKAAIDSGASIADVAKAEVAMNKVTADIEKSVGEADQPAALEKSLGQCVEHLAGLVPKEKVDAFLAEVSAVTKESDMLTAEEKAALAKAGEVSTTLEKVVKANEALTRQVAILSLSKEEQEYLPLMPFEGAELTTAQDKFIAATPEKREEAMKAFPPKKGGKNGNGNGNGKGDNDPDDVGKMIEKAIAESPVLKALQTENADLKKAAKLVEFSKQATELGLPAEHGEVMMKAYAGDAEAIKKHNELVKQIVKAATAQDATSELFKEFGKGGGGEGSGTTAYDQIKLKGEELRKADPKLSPQQARTKVLTDPANAELAARHKNEENARRLGRAA